MMALVLRYGLPGVLLLAVVFAVFGLGWKFGTDRLDAQWQNRWSERDTLEANLRADAVQDARNEEQRRFAAANQVAENARTQTTVIDFGRDQLAVAANGLRFDAGKLSTSPAACPAPTADRSHAATSAAMVLSDLLSRCSATIEELAPAYDRARNAGYACEQTYKSLSPPK